MELSSMNIISALNTTCFWPSGNISVGDKFRKQRMHARMQANHGGRRVFPVEIFTRFLRLLPTHNTIGKKELSATRLEDSGREHVMLSPRSRQQINTKGRFTELFVAISRRYATHILDC